MAYMHPMNMFRNADVNQETELEIDSQDRKVVRYTPAEWFALQCKLEAFEATWDALNQAKTFLDVFEEQSEASFGNWAEVRRTIVAALADKEQP